MNTSSTKSTWAIRVFCLVMVLTMTGILGACSWAGRTAGKTQAKIERKIDAVESGYNDGYSEEKRKTAPKTTDAEPQ